LFEVFSIFFISLQEFLHNQKKYDINRNLFLKKLEKIISVSSKSLDLDPDPDPYIEKRLDPDLDPYIKYTDPQHCLPPQVVSWIIKILNKNILLLQDMFFYLTILFGSLKPQIPIQTNYLDLAPAKRLDLSRFGFLFIWIHFTDKKSSKCFFPKYTKMVLNVN